MSLSALRAAHYTGSITVTGILQRRAAFSPCMCAQRCLKVFAGYPEPFLDVVRDTDPRAVAEHGIFTRPADAMPADGWGRGRVTLVGDAAHPVRPTGARPLFFLFSCIKLNLNCFLEL